MKIREGARRWVAHVAEYQYFNYVVKVIEKYENV